MENINFVAIDFETANNKRSSACSIGVVVVKSGVIVDSYSSYIKPTPSHFDPINIRIHQINPDNVKNAPTFNSIWCDIKTMIGDLPIVAHNASFDRSVLNNVLKEYDFNPISNKFYCTRNLSKHYITGFVNYKLSTVANKFDIELKHHEALSDATACAEILLRICNDQQKKSLEEFDAIFSSKRSKSKSLTNLFETNDNVNRKFDESHPFYDKLIVFTGTLSLIPRKDAWKMIENIGGRWKDSLTKDTDFLILGEVDYARYGDGHKTNKMIEAEENIAKGLSLEILSESDFYSMIDPLDEANESLEITLEKITRDSEFLLKRNKYNDFYSKLIYFSTDITVDNKPYFQDVGNCGGIGHNYYLDDIEKSDYFVISDDIIDVFKNKGDKHSCLIDFETIMRKAAINGTPKETLLISESAFVQYIATRIAFNKGLTEMNIYDSQLPTDLMTNDIKSIYKKRRGEV